jgi:hypothetical protein
MMRDATLNSSILDSGSAELELRMTQAEAFACLSKI